MSRIDQPGQLDRLTAPAIEVERLSHVYGDRPALCDVDLSVSAGETFAVVGPNGGGKTTLFRILSTLLPPQQGQVRIFGLDCATETYEIRRRIGVVFQAPSLDKHLTVQENLRHQAALYGLPHQEVLQRERELLDQLGLNDRRNDRVRTLSGGLRRRVELAKGMLHQPQLLLMDEPSTGLDPGARADLWEYLQALRREFGVTVVLTTHLLDEAEKAQRIAIINNGEVVAIDSPSNLRSEIGGDCVTIAARDPVSLARDIESQFSLTVQHVDGKLRLSANEGSIWLTRLSQEFHDAIESITLSKPTLEDVFIEKTGHRYWSSASAKVELGDRRVEDS